MTRIYLFQDSDGSINVISNNDKEGTHSEFSNEAANWSDEKKFKEALNDFFKKGKNQNAED